MLIAGVVKLVPVPSIDPPVAEEYQSYVSLVWPDSGTMDKLAVCPELAAQPSIGVGKSEIIVTLPDVLAQPEMLAIRVYVPAVLTPLWVEVVAPVMLDPPDCHCHVVPAGNEDRLEGVRLYDVVVQSVSFVPMFGTGSVDVITIVSDSEQVEESTVIK